MTRTIRTTSPPMRGVTSISTLIMKHDDDSSSADAGTSMLAGDVATC